MYRHASLTPCGQPKTQIWPNTSPHGLDPLDKVPTGEDNKLACMMLALSSDHHLMQSLLRHNYN